MDSVKSIRGTGDEMISVKSYEPAIKIKQAVVYRVSLFVILHAKNIINVSGLTPTKLQ